MEPMSPAKKEIYTEVFANIAAKAKLNGQDKLSDRAFKVSFNLYEKDYDEKDVIKVVEKFKEELARGY